MKYIYKDYIIVLGHKNDLNLQTKTLWWALFLVSH